MTGNRDFVLPSEVVLPGHHITVEVVHPARRLPRRFLQRAITAVLEGESVPTAEISVVLCDDAFIRHINAEYLQHDWATDVISFPLSHAPLMGELYISVDTARRQAAEYGVSLQNELVRLAVHGVLHLVGYDDQTDAEQALMHSLQESYVARLTKRCTDTSDKRRSSYAR
ncbi:MAG: rRNA maturation RNase YbeY [Bacteroidota bacterium]|nr:rRNA maturation RNase YbeY [Candidatus Kapabacteria bacterium]MCS7301908.1 rRNA maturation RNase YbeY [Candidatus Kapabacteria bacterium]MCX7936161.1 rRNA maturation RNase YbeY [Chlorobiota bacterium]MDW8074945.1 rRNA maturation RNase YbeY [Bacteroidota bacterium]MDW8271584.1 rRNA maturation RNase YbeY [Bacteroidota bacterium]